MGILKFFLFAMAGFAGAHFFFWVFRWWPSLHVDTRDIPKGEIEDVHFKVALGAAVVAGLVGALV